VDYFIHWLRDSGIEFSVGGMYGSVLRNSQTGNQGETGWANYLDIPQGSKRFIGSLTTSGLN
jgi:hypothetical protein